MTLEESLLKSYEEICGHPMSQETYERIFRIPMRKEGKNMAKICPLKVVASCNDVTCSEDCAWAVVYPKDRQKPYLGNECYCVMQNLKCLGDLSELEEIRHGVYEVAEAARR